MCVCGWLLFGVISRQAACEILAQGAHAFSKYSRAHTRFHIYYIYYNFYELVCRSCVCVGCMCVYAIYYVPKSIGSSAARMICASVTRTSHTGVFAMSWCVYIFAEIALRMRVHVVRCVRVCVCVVLFERSVNIP